MIQHETITKEIDFTVVIPWYKDRDILRRAIASVNVQTFPAREIVIVCNGPGATSAMEIAAEFPSATVLRSTASNANQARNAGAEVALGTHCVYLDADDELMPERLMIIHKAASASPDSFFISRGMRHGAGGKVWAFPRRGMNIDEPIAEYFFVYGNFISSSAIVAPTPAVNKVRFDPYVKKYQDLDFLIRAQNAGFKINFIPEPCFIYHDEDEGERISRRKNFDEQIAWAESYAHFTEKSHAAFMARAIAQHELPKRFFRNLGRLANGYIKGGIPAFHIFAMVLRLLVPDGTYVLLLQSFNKMKIGANYKST